MKRLSLVLGAIALSGCATTITAPQDVTNNSSIDQRYVSYHLEMAGPSLETSSSFNVSNVRIEESGDLTLSGRFKIENENYRTDSLAKMTYNVSLENLGNDEVVIREAYLKNVDLRSVHKPIESSVFKAARIQGIDIAHDLEGQIIHGQTKLLISNKVNEVFRPD